jgi:hypothetical protein
MGAAMHGSAEFFAPLIVTRPLKGRPPVMRNLSIRKFSVFGFQFLLLSLPSDLAESRRSVRGKN